MSDDTKLYFEIAKIVITSILVISGWVVVYFLQRKSASEQELRKELKSRIDEVSDDIRKLKQDCITYYLSDEIEPDLPVAIKILTEEIRAKSMSLSDLLIESERRERIRNILTKLLDNATGGDFETKNRKPASAYDPRLNSVFHLGSQLTSDFDNAFRSRYQLPL